MNLIRYLLLVPTLFFLFSVITPTPLSYAGQEKFVTMYPAPSGNFDRLRLMPRDTIGGTSCNIGTMYYDLTTRGIMFCRNEGVPPANGDGEWVSLPGVWIQNGNDVTLADLTNPNAKRVGVGTQTPEFMLTVGGINNSPTGYDGGIIAKGTYGPSNPALRDLLSLGAGTRLIWYPKKAAFRAGSLNGSGSLGGHEWDDVAIGDYSVAFGLNNRASSPYTTISGGDLNNAQADHATISGGGENNISGNYGTISGGLRNNAASRSTVSGGEMNKAGNNFGTIGGGEGNNILVGSDHSTIGGGKDNFIRVGSAWATIGGGTSNEILNGVYATIGGGVDNHAPGDNSVIAGGSSNHTVGQRSAIVGGVSNTTGTDEVGSQGSFIGGGTENHSNGEYSVITGGVGNTAGGKYSVISGGGPYPTIGPYTAFNTASGNYSVISGGQASLASGTHSVIGGGILNTASGSYSTVSGGDHNSATAQGGSVLGGNSNSAQGISSTVAGGANNTASGGNASVGGGSGNQATGMFSTVPGGAGNLASGQYSLAAGDDNEAAGRWASIPGGGNNHITVSQYASIAGGLANNITSIDTLGDYGYSFIAGGRQNYLEGAFATILGGELNKANGDFSLASGRYMQLSASADRTFVFGYANTVRTINVADAFIIYNENGTKVGIGTINPTHQLQLASNDAFKPGGGAWGDSSDSRLKKDVKPLIGALDKILQLSGVTYEWIDPEQHGQLTGTQTGMIAQDVEKIFPEWVGEDDNGYKTVTIRGFEALTVEALRELKNEINTLRMENAALKQRVAELEKH